ncbi:MAG: pantetheine-phosphate adenylyltransferase [Crocinitomicaceae bacterium]|nr:pantetheine-phosphate adenylyltransferase [Crocinitomicaceae bacterium]
MKRVFFPGSFDPFTKGHESLVLKALDLFDEIIIGIGVNSTKSSMFPLEKRIDHIESLFNNEVKVVSYDSLTINACKDLECTHLLRGLRDANDFEYEKSIALMNTELSSFETVFMLSDNKYSFIASSIIRELYKNGSDISKFVTNVDKLT